MNKWECDEPGCTSSCVGAGGAIGLRAIGWYFVPSSRALTYCPRHRPDKKPCTENESKGDACGQCAGQAEAEPLQDMIAHVLGIELASRPRAEAEPIASIDAYEEHRQARKLAHQAIAAAVTRHGGPNADSLEPFVTGLFQRAIKEARELGAVSAGASLAAVASAAAAGAGVPVTQDAAAVAAGDDETDDETTSAGYDDETRDRIQASAQAIYEEHVSGVLGQFAQAPRVRLMQVIGLNALIAAASMEITLRTQLAAFPDAPALKTARLILERARRERDKAAR